MQIHANRTDRMGSLRINDGEMIHGQSPGVHKGLNLRIPLYIGGVDKNRVEVTPEVQVRDSFSGCISQVKIFINLLQSNSALLTKEIRNVFFLQ